MKIIYIIPARLASTRLESKVLYNINGKPLMEHVINNFQRCNIENFLVACDHEDIVKICKKCGVKSILTDPELPCGTNRVFAAYKKLNEHYDCVVNVQGDLAVFDVNSVKYATDLLENSDYDMTTIGYVLNNEILIRSPNTVKIAIAFKTQNAGQALYFSRSPIPYESPQFYQHVGVYAYRPDKLEKFVNSSVSELEKTERLEQLRLLENDMRIGVAIVPGKNNVMEVNDIEDVKTVESYLNHSRV